MAQRIIKDSRPSTPKGRTTVTRAMGGTKLTGAVIAKLTGEQCEDTLLRDLTKGERRAIEHRLKNLKVKLTPAKRAALAGPVKFSPPPQDDRMERAKERLEDAESVGFRFRRSNSAPDGWMIMAPFKQTLGKTYARKLLQALRWKANGWKPMKPGRKAPVVPTAKERRVADARKAVPVKTGRKPPVKSTHALHRELLRLEDKIVDELDSFSLRDGKRLNALRKQFGYASELYEDARKAIKPPTLNAIGKTPVEDCTCEEMARALLANLNASNGRDFMSDKVRMNLILALAK